MSQSSSPAQDRRIDIYRRGRQYLCIARSAELGSLGLLFVGEIPDEDREALGRHVLEWLGAARDAVPPGHGFQYPEDLLPTGWDVIRWHAFMSEAGLCAVERVDEDRVVLRPYKNLHAVGEEFSHDGHHSLESPLSAVALASALRAALDVARSISQVRKGPRSAYTGPDTLSAGVSEDLARLKARLFDRPPRTEMVEIGEGFFLLPAPLRQLIFDVVWRRGTSLRDGLGRHWEIRWLPLTVDPVFRNYPLFSLFRSEDTELMIRLDSATPDDPEVYRLTASNRHDLSAVLGPPDGPAGQGPRLSKVLRTLQPD